MPILLVLIGAAGLVYGLINQSKTDKYFVLANILNKIAKGANPPLSEFRQASEFAKELGEESQFKMLNYYSDKLYGVKF